MQNAIMQNAIMPNAIMHNAIMPNAIIPNAIMPNVGAQYWCNLTNCLQTMVALSVSYLPPPSEKFSTFYRLLNIFTWGWSCKICLRFKM